MRKLFKLLLLCFSVAILLAACRQQGPVEQENIASEPGPFGKYHEEVTVSAIKVLPSFVQFREGEDINNNIWTKALKDVLNIKMEYLWIVNNWGEPFDQKVNMMLQTNILPDIMPLYTSLFIKAVDSDKYADIKDVYEEYASPRLKAAMSLHDGLPLKSVLSEDGKMLAVARPTGLEGGELLWIKKSWLDKLNAKPPSTFDEFVSLAYRFAREDPDGNEKDDTVGFGMHKDLSGGNSSIESIFAAHEVFPNFWIKGEDGNLVRGETLPSIKEPLKVLSKMYKDGVIDKEFTIKTNDEELKQDIASGKVGMVMGGATLPYVCLKDAYEADKSDWVYVPMPSVEGKTTTYKVSSNMGDFVGASIHSKHPDAVIKVINFVLETTTANPDWANGTSEFITTEEGYAASFYAPFLFDDPNIIREKRTMINDALKNNDPSQLYGDMTLSYAQVKGFEDNTPEGDWASYTTNKTGGSQDALLEWLFSGNHNYISPAYYNDTPAWVKNGASIAGKYKEFVTRAILQGNVDEEFDAYVKYFKEQGGELATEEINEIYRNDPNRIE